MLCCCHGFPCGSAGKESTCNARDLGTIPDLISGLEDLLENNVCPLQHSGLENSMDFTVYGVPKRWTWLNDFQNEQDIQFSSVVQSCPTLCDPMNRSTPGLPVHHQLLEFTQPHIHWVSDAIQPSHPLSSPSPPACNSSQHQSLFQWVNSSHEVAKVLEFQL